MKKWRPGKIKTLAALWHVWWLHWITAHTKPARVRRRRDCITQRHLPLRSCDSRSVNFPSCSVPSRIALPHLFTRGLCSETVSWATYLRVLPAASRRERRLQHSQLLREHQERKWGFQLDFRGPFGRCQCGRFEMDPWLCVKVSGGSVPSREVGDAGVSRHSVQHCFTVCPAPKATKVTGFFGGGVF